MRKISLSLIILAYNEESYLKMCLDSVAQQMDMPDEVIVVDNNSTDRTAAIAHNYPFVTLIREPEQGIVFARNSGFNTSRSELIARIDADTTLPPEWVSNIKADYAERCDDSVHIAVTGPSVFRNITGRFLWYPLHRALYFWPSRLLSGHHTLSGSNMYLTRATWNDIKDGVCLRTDIHEDMDLAIHIYQAGGTTEFSSNFPNTMMGRKVLVKLRYYLMMWWRSMLIEHPVYKPDATNKQQPSAYKRPIVVLNYWKDFL